MLILYSRVVACIAAAFAYSIQVAYLTSITDRFCRSVKRGSSLHLLNRSRLDGSNDRICYGALVAYLAAALFGACRDIYVS
jgi:hypothetical protein